MTSTMRGPGEVAVMIYEVTKRFGKRPFQFFFFNTPPGVQYPVISDRYRLEFRAAQSERFPQEPLRPISIVRLADRLFGRRNADPL